MPHDGNSKNTSSRARRRLTHYLIGLALLATAFSVGLGTYEVLRPADGESARPVTVVVQTQRPDPGFINAPWHVTPAPSPGPVQTPEPTRVPPPLDSIPYQMVIESIGVDAPVVAKGLDAEQMPVVPLNSYQVAWYTFSAQPGTGGNAVFAGHVTWDGRAVFYSLNRLVPGDVIHLTSMLGESLTYAVTESYTVSENDPDAPARVMGQTTTDVITLITCEGEFYYTGDPVFNGSYTNRRVIRAELTSKDAASEDAPH